MKVTYTALWQQGGLIAFIDENGQTGLFAQRGIHSKLTQDEIVAAINLGLLDGRVMNCMEIPANVKLEFEDPYIQGEVEENLPVRFIKSQIRHMSV